VEVETSILVDAPLDDVFAILTEYGGARLRINPHLTAQTVIEQSGPVTVCENVWVRDGKTVRQQRRYHAFPPDRIEEEVVGATTGMIRVRTRLTPEGDQTRLSLTSVYVLRGLWGLVGRFAAGRLRDADDEFLATLKAGIEAEFEEVEEDESRTEDGVTPVKKPQG
jgi:hypothetical protein